MTDAQYKKLKITKFNKKFAELVDKGRISMTNASIAAKIDPADQMLFSFQAQTFSQRAFAASVNQWLKMSEARQKVFRQILEDLDSAFEEWDAWTGNQGTAELMDEYEQMVKEARARVLAYMHHLRVPLPNEKKDLVE